MKPMRCCGHAAGGCSGTSLFGTPRQTSGREQRSHETLPSSPSLATSPTSPPPPPGHIRGLGFLFSVILGTRAFHRRPNIASDAGRTVVRWLLHERFVRIVRRRTFEAHASFCPTDLQPLQTSEDRYEHRPNSRNHRQQ